MQNWLDPSNIWIVINPQTGVVTTAPVAAVDPSTITSSANPDADQRTNWINYSCGLAAQGRALGGK